MVAGAVFGLVCLLRVQLAPAVALMALWPFATTWRRRLLPLFAGGMIVLGFGAVLDWVTLGYPFASIWRYVAYNLFYGVSSGFGVEPWDYYPLYEVAVWDLAIAVVLIASAVGAWRMPALFAGAVVIVATHSMIAHKEYRFIYPAIVLVSILVGLGLAQLAAEGQRRLRLRHITGIAVAFVGVAVIGGWSYLAASVWTGDTMMALRLRVHDNLSAAHFAARMPSICGVGMYGERSRDWARYGGYTLLHRPVPLFWPEDEQDLEAQATGFNVLLFTAPPPAQLGFETIRCFGKTCIGQRPGSCMAQTEPPMPFPEPLLRMAPPPADFAAVPA